MLGIKVATFIPTAVLPIPGNPIKIIAIYEKFNIT
jgi:hypothetical protein